MYGLSLLMNRIQVEGSVLSYGVGVSPCSELEEHNTPKRPILAFKALLQTLLKFVFILFAGTLPKRLVRFHHWSPRPLALTQAKPQTLPHVLNRPSQQPSL
ncbi:hypothetical protein FOBRF1_005635 [Fusarium oxysporum]